MVSLARDRQTFILDYGYFRGCAGKSKFNSEKNAAKHIEIHGYENRRAYKCKFCEYWHMTSKGHEQ